MPTFMGTTATTTVPMQACMEAKPTITRILRTTVLPNPTPVLHQITITTHPTIKRSVNEILSRAIWHTRHDVEMLFDKVMVALAAITLTGWSYSLRAETANHAESSREKALEKRIFYLEERLRRVETLLRKEPYLKSASYPKVTTRADPKSLAKQVADVPESVAREHPSAPDAADASSQSDVGRPASQTPRDPDSSVVGAADDGPQELNVLRENAVTLKPAGFEFSNELDYIQRKSSLQRDRALLSTTSIRYGVLDWLELSMTIPAGYSTRVSDTSPVSAATQHVTGFGDLIIQANARVVDQTANWPGVVMSLGLIAPTGANPYDFSHYSVDPANGIPTLNPRNPLADYFSQGAWGLHTNLQFYKSVDPVILFIGFGLDRILPLTISRYTVDGYTRLAYNFGLSFALSEKTTLGFSVVGSYTPDLKVNGRNVFQSAEEPTLARLTIIQRLMKNVYLEPSVSFGLNEDSPDFILGVGVRARF